MASDAEMQEALDACSKDQTEKLETLLKKGICLKLCLDHACRFGSLNVVKFLHEKKEVSLGDGYDIPIFRAVIGGFLKLTRYLLDNGVKATDVMLAAVAEHGHLEVVKLLVESGANPKACESHALICAREKGYVKVVDYLVEKGADRDANRAYETDYFNMTCCLLPELHK